MSNPTLPQDDTDRQSPDGYCPKCNGTGVYHLIGGRLVRCPACAGTGWARTEPAPQPAPSAAQIEALEFGPQTPPSDTRIFNRPQPDGSYRPLSEFFDVQPPAPEPRSKPLTERLEALDNQLAERLAEYDFLWTAKEKVRGEIKKIKAEREKLEAALKDRQS